MPKMQTEACSETYV